jgi:hypothetical protein
MVPEAMVWFVATPQFKSTTPLPPPMLIPAQALLKELNPTKISESGL